MSAQRFAGVELSSIAKRDSDRQQHKLEQEARRARADQHGKDTRKWQYRTPGGKRRTGDA